MPTIEQPPTTSKFKTIWQYDPQASTANYPPGVKGTTTSQGQRAVARVGMSTFYLRPYDYLLVDHNGEGCVVDALAYKMIVEKDDAEQVSES